MTTQRDDRRTEVLRIQGEMLARWELQSKRPNRRIPTRIDAIDTALLSPGSTGSDESYAISDLSSLSSLSSLSTRPSLLPTTSSTFRWSFELITGEDNYKYSHIFSFLQQQWRLTLVPFPESGASSSCAWGLCLEDCTININNIHQVYDLCLFAQVSIVTPSCAVDADGELNYSDARVPFPIKKLIEIPTERLFPPPSSSCHSLGRLAHVTLQLGQM